MKTDLQLVRSHPYSGFHALGIHFPAEYLDYRPSRANSITFTPHELSKCILVPIIDDDLVEATQEGFNFNLTSTDGDVLVNPDHVVVGIIDDDSEFNNLLLLVSQIIQFHSIST